MKTPLQTIDILSIYTNKKKAAVSLPTRMAKCTPDTYKGILGIGKDLKKLKGKLVLSDLFRSYEMQLQAHIDFTSGKKTAFSPAPGGSLHEAGRGMDIDLKSIKVSLKDFWGIAAKHGFYPIINKADARLNEAWHFDCRGSHQIVYEYYQQKKGTNFKPYAAMAISAILSINVPVDAFGDKQKEAQIQAGVIRLGKVIGDIDGKIGKKTKKAIEELGVQYNENDVDGMLTRIENLLHAAFPSEY